MRHLRFALLSTAAMLVPRVGLGQAEPSFKRTADVVYGRKHGMALTMDVFTPAEKANGAAVIWVVSGGWVSNHNAINPQAPYAPGRELVGRGYTVFAVVHGSQPRFTIPEILEDLHLATRYVRSHARDYRIDPERIGITGGSAGGHLSLMQATAGHPDNPEAKDPLARTSSRVQAVACFYPPTDFLNYDKEGVTVLEGTILKDFRPPFAFHELKKSGYTGEYVPITDREKVRAILEQISPITHVTADDPPTLIIHGDQDALVPIGQAERMVAKLKEASVPAELVVKKGAKHGWAGLDKDMAIIADWFDKHLKMKSID
jgi:acetyl esterase/lipase